MNSKLKIFIKVVYYIAAFSLGIFLALYLPNTLYYNETMKTITSSLNDGNYKNAMIYIGGYFNDEYVYVEKFDDNSGIVLFEANTVINNPKQTDEAKYYLQDSYAGFIFNVKDKFKVSKSSDNKTKLYVTDFDGKEKEINILDRDTNADGYYDTSNTYEDYGFIFLDLSKLRLNSSEEIIKSVKSLKFVDCDGNTFKEFDLSSKNLKYDSTFYTDVHAFADVFNVNNKDTRLTDIASAFTAKSTHYTYSNYGSGNSNVTTKAILLVLAYFVVVYLIADSVLGKRYVYRGIKMVICKIFKIDPKVKPDKEISSYASDYYSQVTITLDISSLSEEDKNNFPEEVEVKYNNEVEIIDFIIKKENQYKQTERIKAGIYTNLQTNLSKEEYSFSGAAKIKVSGFKTNILIIVKKKGVIR